MKTLFTAEASSKGGRSGTIQSPDGLLNVELGNPLEAGLEKRGPSPELLFAEAYAACYHGAIHNAARKAGAMIQDSTVRAVVSLTEDADGGFHLSVALHAPASIVSLPVTASIFLGTADPFGVLAGTSVTSTGTTVVNGDLGVYPGFSPGVVNGTIVADGSIAQQALADALAAYVSLGARIPAQNPTGSDPGGLPIADGGGGGGLFWSGGDLIAGEGVEHVAHRWRWLQALVPDRGRENLSGAAQQLLERVHLDRSENRRWYRSGSACSRSFGESRTESVLSGH